MVKEDGKILYSIGLIWRFEIYMSILRVLICFVIYKFVYFCLFNMY